MRGDGSTKAAEWRIEGAGRWLKGCRLGMRCDVDCWGRGETPPGRGIDLEIWDRFRCGKVRASVASDVTRGILEWGEWWGGGAGGETAVMIG